MSLADAKRLAANAPPDPTTPLAQPVPPPPAPAAPWSPPPGTLAYRRPPARRRDGLSRDAGRLLAASFGIAWILCPSVEPMPSGSMHYPLWQLPIDLAAVVSIVAAVVVLWRGGRHGARLVAVAGALMAVETMICPLAGHTPVGWWTWVQTGLSLYVLGAGAVLMARAGRPAA